MRLLNKLAVVEGLALLTLIGAASTTQAVDHVLSPQADVFRKNVKVEIKGEELLVRSDGIPDHETGPFPNPHNPNTIKKQNYLFKIPL